MWANYRLGSNWIVGRIKIFVLRMKSYDIRFVVRHTHARIHAHSREQVSSMAGWREWTIYNGRDSAAIVSGREAIQTGFIVSRQGRGRYHWLASLPTPLISLGASSNWQSKILSRASFRIVNRLICVMRWINGRECDRGLSCAEILCRQGWWIENCSIYSVLHNNC